MRDVAPSGPGEAPALDLALVLVERLDRRMLPALRLAAALPGVDVRALHLSVEPAVTATLAAAWMELGLAALPLHIDDPSGEPLVTRLEAIVAREAAGRSRVMVIVPELDLGRWWQPLVHRSTGRRIARKLHGMRQVSTVIVPYPVPG